MQVSLEALNITTKGVIGTVDVCVCCKSRSRNVRKPATGIFVSNDNEDKNGKEQVESDYDREFLGMVLREFSEGYRTVGSQLERNM